MSTEKYKISDSGTYYNVKTSDKIIRILEDIIRNKTRCRFYWGDTATGMDWGDTYDVRGTIGRSTNKVKIPILMYNKKSLGGTAILTHCIVKITTTKGGEVLYQHPNYHQRSQNLHNLKDSYYVKRNTRS